MFGHQPFFFDTMTRHVKAFGKMFDDIHIERTNSAGEVVQLIKVPLTYAPKQKIMLRADVDPDATKETAIILPHMSFMLLPGFEYDGTRRSPPLEKYVALDGDDANKFKRQYVAVPYNFRFQLSVYVNHVSDGNKIVEQILPFFTPDWTLNMPFCEETGIYFDVPFTLEGVECDDQHWGEKFTDRRVLVWNLTFHVKSYFLGPVKSKPIIKIAYERFMFGSPTANSDIIGNTDIAATISVYPGMDANGAATSNSAVTVDRDIIYATNSYGYIETFDSSVVDFE